MKTNNIFDHMKAEPDNIDEQTVLEETGVSKDRVKEIVMENISTSKKTTKKGGKKVFVVLAAAVAATIAVGTITAGATGSFNSVFTPIFAGDPVDGMYSADSATIKSDVVNIDYKGVAGDKREAYAIYNITKKDGTPFIADKNSYLSLIQMSNDTGYVADVSCTIPLFDQLTEGLFYRADIPGGDVSYDMIDDYTVQAYVQFRDEGRNIIGQTVTVKDETIVINHIDEILGTHDELFGADSMSTDEKKIEEIYAYAEKKMTGNQEISITPDMGLAIVTPEEVNIEYEISFPLSYKKISKSFDVEGKKVTFDGSEMTMHSMEALPLSIRLIMTYDDYDLDKLNEIALAKEEKINNGEELPLDYVTITLEDGNSYTFDNSPYWSSDDTVRLRFSYYKDFKTFTIDPEKIVKVEFNGRILYNK